MFTVLCFTALAQSDQPPFSNEIKHFKQLDSAHFPGKNKVLFVGSSSFTKWTDVQKYFPEVPIINRGFGGSSLPDVIRFADDVIFKYDPKQIVIYCGENDFAASDTVTVSTVFSRFQTLYAMIRGHYKEIPVAYVSMKPSPSRVHLLKKYVEANNRIKSFLQMQRNTAFIDVYHSMFADDGQMMTDIFIGDNLHMNANGYAIWQKIIAPYLLKK